LEVEKWVTVFIFVVWEVKELLKPL
jgi:hypothetical protein